MIAVTDLHGKLLYVNADMIELVESNPDTQIVLSNGQHIYVQESPEEIARRTVNYRRECGNQAQPGPSEEAPAGDEVQ